MKVEKPKNDKVKWDINLFEKLKGNLPLRLNMIY